MALKRPKLAEPEPPRSLAGAAAVLDLGAESSWKTWKFGNRDWQVEAWRLYDVVGELHFLAGRIGDSVAQARLYVTEVDETGEETGEVQDAKIQRLAAVPLGTGARRDECLRLAGVDVGVAGEFWIVGEGAAKDPLASVDSWFVVTGAALSKSGERVTVSRPKSRGGGKLTLRDGEDFLIRGWRAHPNDIDQADCPTRPGIVPLREIELLTKREFAELDSRLTGAGIMFVPEGVDFPRLPEDPPGIAGFMSFIQRAAAASMRGQGAASSMVPIIASLPAEMMQYVDQIRPVTFWSELSADITPMKKAAIARLASFYEIPGEVLEGIGNANHWTAWLISEEGIRWIRGYLGVIADALTRGFLQPALRAMGIVDPERYAFAFDTAPLAARPNRLDDALKLRELNLLSDEETVKAGAFDPEQMPAAEELVRQRLWALVQTQPDLILDPAVQRVLGFPQVRSVGLPATADQNADGDTPGGRDEPPNSGVAPELPAPDQARALTAALSSRIAALTAAPAPRWDAAFEAACKLLVLRALELAGGRMTTPQERSPRGRWADVPRHQLHARIGPVVPDRADRLMDGAFAHVQEIAGDLGVDADQLELLLAGYCRELLTRGLPHSDDLLFAALSVANRGRGLVNA